jgi:hypothetical protein
LTRTNLPPLAPGSSAFLALGTAVPDAPGLVARVISLKNPGEVTCSVPLHR